MAATPLFCRAEPVAGTKQNVPEMIDADGHLRLTFGEEQLVLPRGLQPFMLCTKTGTLVVQAQVPEKPFASSRMTYPWALETWISRDIGKHWTKFPGKAGENGLNAEGGMVQLRDGTILGLDTYITPGKKNDEGLGQLYTSTDDWHTLEGPKEVRFNLPNIDFYCSKDDGGHPHDAQRLHRRILELPSGDLLTCFYGFMKGDSTPSTYMPTMMKSRVMIARSKDRGQTWSYISTVAADPTIGTEGFDEPTIVRISKGPHAGRILCLMRTGRELRESFSDDEGATWSPHRARVFANLDIYRTELWVDHFRTMKGAKGKLLDENNPEELRGAVVDPELIELRSGIVVAAFGVRIPQKACWRDPNHSWNGNYLALSLDHGETWKNVVRLTSGVLTTHYMAVEETSTDNKIYVVYDLGSWTKGKNRDVFGRSVEIAVKK